MQSLNTSKNRYSLVALLIAIIVIGYLVLSAIPLNVFAYDILGYYLYLPTGFKYKDIALNNYDQLQSVLATYGTSEGFSHAFKVENGNWVMKYPMGLAVLYYPFYVIGDNLAHLLKYPTDGFSLPYQLSVLYGCYIYTIIGLVAFRKVLLHFFTDKMAGLTLLLIVFGTNYLLHVSIHAQPAMSHNLLFSLHALTFYFTIKWHKTFKVKYIIGLATTIGLATISRPPEVLIIFVPLLYNVFNFKTLVQKIKLLYAYKNHFLLCAGIITVIVSYQLFYWKLITGNFLFDSYSNNLNEGFNFSHPYILEFLFSFRKGWLLFTPIMAFSLIGFYYFYRAGKLYFFSVFVYFIINFYVITSWSCWWYGISFSARAIIPAYVALSIPLGYFLSKVLSGKAKYMVFPALIILVVFNLFQSWQASKGILEGSRMTRAYYKSVFLQTTLRTPEQEKLLLRDKYASSDVLKPWEVDLSKHKLVYSKVENFDNKSNDQPNIIDTLSYSKNKCFLTNKDYSFAADIITTYNEITKKSYLILKISARVYTRENPDELEARLVLNMQHKGKCYDFKCIDTRKLGLKKDTWNYIEFYMWTPDFWDRRDIIQGYFWNMSDKNIFVDDVEVQAFEPIIDESVF